MGGRFQSTHILVGAGMGGAPSCHFQILSMLFFPEASSKCYKVRVNDQSNPGSWSVMPKLVPTLHQHVQHIILDQC